MDEHSGCHQKHAKMGIHERAIFLLIPGVHTRMTFSSTYKRRTVFLASSNRGDPCPPSHSANSAPSFKGDSRRRPFSTSPSSLGPLIGSSIAQLDISSFHFALVPRQESLRRPVPTFPSPASQCLFLPAGAELFAGLTRSRFILLFTFPLPPDRLSPSCAPPPIRLNFCLTLSLFLRFA